MSLLNQKGFTLLEVLVAIVIVAVGLLAVAGMQSTAITGNASARDATIAVQLAEEIVDRVRINAREKPELYRCMDTNNPASTASGTNAGCAAWGRPLSDPAMGDYDQWRLRLQSSGLSGVRGTVMVSTDTPIGKTAIVTVTVEWGSIVAIRTVTFQTVMEIWPA